MSKSYWLKDQKGNFSKEGKDTFDPSKRYVGIRLQQGVPLLDRDWNELEDIRRYEELMLRKWYIGNGTPDDGFKISSVGPPANDFKIKAGRCIVDGFEAVNEPYFSIDAAKFENDLNNDIISKKLKGIFKTKGFPLSENAKATKGKEDEWVITDEEKFIVKKEDGKLNIYADYILYSQQDDVADLNSPTDPVDTVYLDVWIEERKSGEGEYDAPDNSQDVEVPTCVRHKLEWRVRVDEGSKGDYKVRYHHYYDIARIRRVAGRNAIFDTDIDDLRTTWLAMDLIQNRFKGVINTILKGNLPSDPKVRLAVLRISGDIIDLEVYKLSFEDTKGNIWMFWYADGNIWCKICHAGTWSEDTKVTTAETSSYRNAFEDAQGNIWLFWYADGNIKCKTNRAGIWRDDEKLATGPYHNAFEDADGNIWLFWYDDGIIRCKTNRAGSWGRETQLTTGERPIYRNAFEDADGNIWLFWSAGNNIWCRTNRADRWGRETQLITGERPNYPNAVEDADGNIWLFWYDDGIIRCKTNRAGTWGADEALTTVGTAAGYPNAFEDTHGNIWLFWSAGNNIWCRTNRAGSWGRETQLTTGEWLNYRNAFEDAHGNIWLFWSAGNNIWCKKTYYAGGWEYDTQLTTGAERYIKSFEDHEGSIWLLFYKPNNNNIWCKRYVDGDWLAEMRLCSGAKSKIYRDSFEDHEGNIWLFWEEWTRTISMWCKKCYASL
jgi:predicted lactoylglutathione lyase